MTRSEQTRNGVGGMDLWMMAAAIAIAALLIVAATPAQAQTFTVLHNFTNGADGSGPFGGVTLDRAGNLYGTTTSGGNGDGGTVYKLSHIGSGRTLNTLYAFNHPNDPILVMSGVVFGPDGLLYGTGYEGGANHDGAVFNLRPPATVCGSVSCPWTLTLVHSFSGSDGSYPDYGNLIFDSAGNIYGTTSAGGAYGYGTVFELTRSGSSWTETVLYSFTGGDDGACPESGVAFDSAGNLYGTTNGCDQDGTVYELSPSGSGWSETTLYNFTGNGDAGISPIGGVAVDSSRNLYGTTSDGGSGGDGTAWVLSPSGGNWTLTVVQSFSNGYEGPFATPTLDAAGNVYGTSSFSGEGDGLVFKLTPSGSGWNYTDYDFSGNDGRILVGGVTIDASGNLYGTAAAGGSYNQGVVWEITP